GTLCSTAILRRHSRSASHSGSSSGRTCSVDDDFFLGAACLRSSRRRRFVSPRSRGRLLSVSTRPPYRSGSERRNPSTTSCRMTERHALLESSAPMPNTESEPCRCCVTFSVALPSSTSTTCAAPKRWPVRYTAERSFRAASVPSQVSGGFKQLSQLPQLCEASSPKY